MKKNKPKQEFEVGQYVLYEAFNLEKGVWKVSRATKVYYSVLDEYRWQYDLTYTLKHIIPLPDQKGVSQLWIRPLVWEGKIWTGIEKHDRNN